ncbi:tRNA (guanine-N(1)-)-methyltransferase [Pigmentiphaga litoralis]|nr:tRNA (guanine-N(1)-)-methyltransferase [Pigmentiphaga litoralis]
MNGGESRDAIPGVAADVATESPLSPAAGLRFDVVTLFGPMFSAVTEQGVTGRAHTQSRWRLNTWNPRDFTTDVHRTVDDRPYGGGPGMVMRVDPLEKAVAAIQADRASAAVPVILMSPQGRRFDQARAQALADSPGAILVCGRYEGIDQRFIDRWVTEEISLGDFVLSGGEIAALAVVDATVRLLPGVLNDGESAVQDSFNEHLSGLLDCPHYTRPEVFDGVPVPDVLMSGHHANIVVWRRRQSLEATARKRPDLIVAARERGWLSRDDEKFLSSLTRRDGKQDGRR